MNITEASKKLFLDLANDAGNWNGTPGLGCNVPSDRHTRGNVTQLKRAGYVTTFKDEGITWVQFTVEGKAFAKANGVDLSWI
jgi:hypothetical protein